MVYKAPLRGRPAPPATLAQEEKVHQITPNRHRVLFVIVVANWRLDNAKSPAAMLQEKTARKPHTLRVADVVRTYVQPPGRVLLFFF